MFANASHPQGAHRTGASPVPTIVGWYKEKLRCIALSAAHYYHRGQILAPPVGQQALCLCPIRAIRVQQISLRLSTLLRHPNLLSQRKAVGSMHCQHDRKCRQEGFRSRNRQPIIIPNHIIQMSQILMLGAHQTHTKLHMHRHLIVQKLHHHPQRSGNASRTGFW